MRTLDTIHASVPRVFVNLVAHFDISQIYKFSKGVKYCAVVHSLINECDCCFGKNSSDESR